MPGLGFLIGGAVTAIFSPRTSYAVAGSGVLVVLGVAAIALSRASWRGEPAEDLAATEPARTGAPSAGTGGLKAPEGASR
jgi:hypothetical protein